MTTPGELGAQFRMLRLRRGLSLSEVAGATGMSASFLSLFETGKNDITFARLVRLAGFYGVAIGDLVPDPEPDEPLVVHAGARRRLESGSEHAVMEILTHDVRQKFVPVLVTLEPGGRLDTPARELFVHVLRGRLTIANGGGEPIPLARGDSAYFADDRARTFENRGRTVAEWIAVWPEAAR